jgi:thiamine biosynthesis protein ThiI
MKTLFLNKIGEISLKGGNRSFFEKKLKENIKNRFRGIPVTVKNRRGRFYVETEEQFAPLVQDGLSQVFGIVSFARSFEVEKNMESIRKVSCRLAGEAAEQGAGTFKVEARRTDKNFPFNSMEICREIGHDVLEAVPALSVDVHKPEWQLNIEIRDRIYLYGRQIKGPGGLPVSSAGRGILLLSGGIDSPVAGYLMAKRGLKLDAVYFHTYPYTSDEAKQKVIDLSRILAPYLAGLNLFIVPFTEPQLAIKKKGPEAEVTILMRIAMMRIAQALARQRNAGAIVTGEALSQVASQTTESIRVTGSFTDLPLLRPLIGMDKEEIITIARKIGTFETSILPHEDCCTLFAPKWPVTRPKYEATREHYKELCLEGMLEKALNDAERVYSRVENLEE